MTSLVTAKEIADEINLDPTEEEITRFNSLIIQVTSMIRTSIRRNITDEIILSKAPNIYNRLITSLVTHFYYDQNLSSGFSQGEQILLDLLRSEVLEYDKQ